MMNVKKLAAYALGPLGSAAAGAVSLPLASWYFSADDIGRVILLQTAASLVLTVTALGLDQAYIREYHAAADRNALLKTTALLPMLLAAGGAAAFGVFAPEWLSARIFGTDSAELGVLCVLFAFALAVSRFLSLVLRMQERAYAFSLSQFLPKLLILVLVAGCMLADVSNGTFHLLAVYVAAQWLALAVLAVQTRHDAAAALRAPADGALLKTSLQYGLPLMVGGLAYWGLTSVDRIMLRQYGSFAELGIYSMAAGFGAAALIFQSIFSTVWAPTVFRLVHENHGCERIARIVVPMAEAVAAVWCLAGLASPLIPLLLPEHYAPVQFVFLSSILFPLLYTLTEVTGIGINVSRKTQAATWVSLAALAANVLLCRLLVPAYGARGAAAATAVSFWLYFVLKTELSSRLWLNMPRLPLYGISLFCLCSGAVYTLFGSRAAYPLFAACWLAALLLMVIRRRKELHALFEKLKGRLNALSGSADAD